MVSLLQNHDEISQGVSAFAVILSWITAKLYLQNSVQGRDQAVDFRFRRVMQEGQAQDAFLRIHT